jgi:mannose-6-phosphate isomerase-like protein (cupin superfamily)
MIRAAIVIAVLATPAAVGIGAGSRYPDYPHHYAFVPHDKVEAIVKQTGFASRSPALNNEIYPKDNDLGIRASVGKRGPTPPTDGAEVHGEFGHTWLILDGEGTLVIGGTLVNPKDLGNGNWSGSAVTGGDEIHLTKGDIITCQVGMPHWWKDVPKSVTYIAFHVFPAK